MKSTRKTIDITHLRLSGLEGVALAIVRLIERALIHFNLGVVHGSTRRYRIYVRRGQKLQRDGAVQEEGGMEQKPKFCGIVCT